MDGAKLQVPAENAAHQQMQEMIHCS